MSKKVIGFHYTLKDSAGNQIDSSAGMDPLYFLEQSNQIIPGLEIELVKMNVGDKKNIAVKAKDAYGEVEAELVITVKKSQFPDNGSSLKLGDQFQINENPHSPVFTVMKLTGDEVTIDGNHPMAGKDLFFDVEIKEVRNATEEEVAHGHPHGPGGQNHH